MNSKVANPTPLDQLRALVDDCYQNHSDPANRMKLKQLQTLCEMDAALSALRLVFQQLCARVGVEIE